ncbi:Monooxygenase, FAD-binding protein [Niveomyces insectorum RCEF 264]|uniref:Monooxygenase, FAD-binding protein n=1 Tax=Niveomyces insectorum RCEF 264 TaxID=1081102 RepID=A0A167PJE2_9HYPO|nr:Monooxygenase, FAD-binding protein [Niveomyces insectorum RCEF 264]
MADTANPGFRAVIVGGGPVGLCLAHAFTLVGIDYVLLERRETAVEPAGFSVALWPHGVRILDQLGLLEEGRKVYLPMKDKYNQWPDGSKMGYNTLYEEIERSHGHPWMLFQRPVLLRLLYERLRERESRVLTGKKVVSIETHEDGVKVHCHDGSVVEGSLVVGCDGVFSRVRSIMRDLRLASGAGVSDGETSMPAQYQLLTGSLPRVEHLPAGTIWETRNNKMNVQVFMLEREGWFLAYKRLPEPVHQSTPYTDDDARAFAHAFMDQPVVGKDMLFRDLWALRKWARLLDLEEGFARHWYHDRIVLLGDAVHKMTPNAGLGLNQGWQGAVALTNALRSLLSTNPEPDARALTAAFATYKTKTEKMAKDAYFLSKIYIRITAWHNIAYKAADYLGPYIGGDTVLLNMLASPFVKRGLVLDSIPEPGYKVGRIPWDNQPYKTEDEETDG